MKSLSNFLALSKGYCHIETTFHEDGSLTLYATSLDGRSHPRVWRLTSGQLANHMLFETVLTDIERQLKAAFSISAQAAANTLNLPVKPSPAYK
ncbi:hypothetical protein IQ22_02836 [Pseudomonas duriflava]|uniref:DUF3509 domain-containing protein n=2 Tax=Pseudomonas duriflava TaxID=459528 RepID=A0A562QA08_9PSED|nr:hypothetical protein IQ22_02836 [Pseudomonas duriflava]